MTQRDDDGLRTDAELSSLWTQYLDLLVKTDAAAEAHMLALDRLETSYLKSEARTRGAKWDDLKARFMELQRDAPNYSLALFKPCATLAALRLMRRAGGDPKLFFWIDRLRKQESNHEASTSAAVSFWLDRLREDSPTRGTIHQVCQASADYCGRLSRGYMPTLHFLGLAQGEHGNEQRDSRSIPANGQRKPTRGMSQLTRALVMGLIQRPEANGAWLSQWLDEQGVLPTPKMVKNDRRSFEDAYGDPSLKHGLEVLFSRIRRRMARNRAL